MKKLFIAALIIASTYANLLSAQENIAEEPKIAKITAVQQIEAQEAMNRTINYMIANYKPEELQRFVKYYNQLNQHSSKYNEKKARVNTNSPADLQKFFRENFASKAELKDLEEVINDPKNGLQ